MKHHRYPKGYLQFLLLANTLFGTSLVFKEAKRK